MGFLVGDGRIRLNLRDPRAVEFGKLRGWTLAERGVYGWREIAGPPHSKNTRKNDDPYGSRRAEKPPYSDHTWFYRKGRRAVAIVTFPYHAETLDVAMELSLWADTHGMNVEINPPDYPNWYGHNTTMIVWTRKQ